MKIIIGTDGLGREQNPYYCENLSAYTCYELPEASICQGCRNHSEFENTHPALPVISPTGEAVTEPGDYEVGMVWQARNSFPGDKWVTCNTAHIFDDYTDFKVRGENMNMETRQIYRILPQPKEAVKEEKVDRASILFDLATYGRDKKVVDVVKEETVEEAAVNRSQIMKNMEKKKLLFVILK